MVFLLFCFLFYLPVSEAAIFELLMIGYDDLLMIIYGVFSLCFIYSQPITINIH